MNNFSIDFRQILIDFEERHKINSLSKAVCLRFSIDPTSNELVGTFGALSCSNNQQALKGWITEQSIDLNSQPEEELRQQLFDLFERYWTSY